MITEHVSAWAVEVRDPLREQKRLRWKMSLDQTDVAANRGPPWYGLVPGKPGHLGTEPLSHQGTLTIKHPRCCSCQLEDRKSKQLMPPGGPGRLSLPHWEQQAQQTHWTLRARRVAAFPVFILQSACKTDPACTEQPSDHPPCKSSPLLFFCN